MIEEDNWNKTIVDVEKREKSKQFDSTARDDDNISNILFNCDTTSTTSNNTYDDSNSSNYYAFNDENEFIKKTSNYSKHYSKDSFWNKLSTHYKSVSAGLLEASISLYYSLRDGDTPKWARRVIIGALGYFIFPVDLLPDFIPVIGYSDDAAVILSALATVTLYIKPIHKEKAKNKIKKIFNFSNKNN